MVENSPNEALRRADVLRRADRAAPGFAGSDFVHRRCFDGLLERMRPMRLEPRRIVDLGSATGAGSRRLAKTFRRARVTAVDLSAGMLREARRQRSRFSRIREVQADACALPFAVGAFDMAIANLLLPWIGAPEVCLGNVGRVLRRDGLFLFSALGPDSLRELRDAFGAEDDFQHVNPFIDMHDIGDLLLRAGLRDPVLDVDPLTVTYRDVSRLYADLTAIGARNSLSGRRMTLTGKAQFARVAERLAAPSGGRDLAVSLEIVFGHAWGGGPRRESGEYAVDPASIGRLRR